MFPRRMEQKYRYLPAKTSLTGVYPLSRRDIIRNCRLGQRAEPGYLSELTLPVSGVTCHGFFTSSDVTSPLFLRDSTSLCDRSPSSGGLAPIVRLVIARLLVITVVRNLFIVPAASFLAPLQTFTFFFFPFPLLFPFRSTILIEATDVKRYLIHFEQWRR